jgi:hypothetical protein
MRIAESEVWRVDFALREPYTIAYQTYDRATNFFVRLRADDGHEGFGCASPAADVTGETVPACAAALEGLCADIEAGAEDVESSEESHEIYCDYNDLNDVANALEAELGESETTKLIWKPTVTTELGLEGAQKLMRLIEALEDDDDVQTVTANFEISDDVMAQL